MKKELKLTIIVMIVAIAIILLYMLSTNKKIITSDEFIELSSKLGYNTSRSNETTPATIIEFWTAQKNDYEINFHVTMPNIDKKAKKIITDNYFNQIKEEYEKFKDSSSKEEYHSYGNFSKYTLSTDEFYIKVTKIDNTIMFTKVPVQYKDDIINLFNQLGY